MNLQEALTTEDPTISRRREPKFWEPFAWAVRVIVDRGYGTTEACRRILQRGGIAVTKENVAILRVRYYAIRTRPWPQSLEPLRANQNDPVEGKQVEEPPEKIVAAPAESMAAEWGEVGPEEIGDTDDPDIDDSGSSEPESDIDDFEV